MSDRTLDLNKLTVAVWNTSAMFCIEPHVRHARISRAVTLAKKSDITFLLETHGNSADLALFQGALGSQHLVFSSFGEVQGAGGVVATVGPSLRRLFGTASVFPFEVTLGRSLGLGAR